MKATTSRKRRARRSIDDEVEATLGWLESHSTKATLDGMARYAIPSDKAYGVAMRDIKAFGKTLGRNHELALALWNTGVYEARMLASFVGDPALLTPAQMDRWCRDFDNWALCDALSFNLFDRTPHAWAKVTQWSRKRKEFEKRTAFAPPSWWRSAWPPRRTLRLSGVGKDALRDLTSPAVTKRLINSGS